ncbi:hemolysin family protein [Psychromicrobium sp. YIM B11713]|uniref:hemolysin family protein n=1 Tax=Psychromicrobium sp. YIM B11713 TaxID=3145233 RepID=UPI00374F9237
MITAILTAMALAFIVIAAVITMSEAALNFLPRHEVETIQEERDPVRRNRQASLRTILDHPVAHQNALRFWRIWFEMAAAVAVAMLFLNLIDNIWIAGLLATAVMAAIGFVLVGVSPRQFGRLHPLSVARATAWLIRLLCWILGPIPRWLIRVGNVFAPGAPRAETAFASEEEFREFVDRASESDMIEDDEAELIQSVFELDDTLVRAVMVPRTDIVSIERGSTLKQALALFIRSGYSRIPVIGEDSDQVLGVLYLKDVVATQQRLGRDEAAPSVELLSREVRYVPDSKAVGDLLRELQRESTHVAIVIDEYGGTAGLVTLEDLIEEIVGEIVDEYDSEDPEVEEIGPNTYRISAKMSVDDLGELFDVDLEDDEVDTVGGLLSKHLGKVPIVGSEVQVDGIELRAERLEGRRNRVSHLIASRLIHQDDDRDDDEAELSEKVEEHD